MFEPIFEKIDAHPRYGPALKAAVGTKSRLFLNYHTHGGPTGYCVSICRKKPGSLPVLGQPEPMEELAHIRGVGQTEAECLPLMTVFGRQLYERYKLEALPTLYLNGRPYKPGEERPRSGGSAQ